ncbi:hypothetical protein DUI87_18740 [Hirundo rustica rustica]|uniref:Uncharacterized protein n=1 Tax=Hirundo rustica rustica TaxID=333673 RepID=A0A3M0K2U3_HIRRU|nr:hypothetical protein DUI87_18740 [Hirundo rustica rustica]
MGRTENCKKKSPPKFLVLTTQPVEKSSSGKPYERVKGKLIKDEDYRVQPWGKAAELPSNSRLNQGTSSKEKDGAYYTCEYVLATPDNVRDRCKIILAFGNFVYAQSMTLRPKGFDNMIQ